MTNHRPEPKEHPGLVVVGDYLFDSTLNGLLDSSDAATDIIVTEMMRLRHARGENRATVSNKIDRDYFENYRGVGPYREVWQQFSDPDYLTNLIKITWNRTKTYKLLVAGSASGELVGALRARGIDAWGIENNRAIHATTPAALKKFNLFGSIVDMPFEDGQFDFVYETSLCHVSESRTRRAVRELNRVVKTRLDLRLRHQRHGAGVDRSLRSAARREEAGDLVGMVGDLLQQRLRPRHEPQRLRRRIVGGGHHGQQGAGSLVRGFDSLRYSLFDKVEEDD